MNPAVVFDVLYSQYEKLLRIAMIKRQIQLMRLFLYHFFVIRPHMSIPLGIIAVFYCGVVDMVHSGIMFTENYIQCWNVCEDPSNTNIFSYFSSVVS